MLEIPLSQILIILSGIFGDSFLKVLRSIFKVFRFLLLIPIPTLGVCLGHQAIAQAFNSKIIQSGKPVHGKVSLIYHNSLGLFDDLKSPFKATRYHSLIIDKKSISKNLNITAKTEDGVIMGIQHVRLPFYGVQFHPESIATEYGHKIVKNFINCI